MDEILQDFVSETSETMEAIGGEIVAWEADPTDRDRLDTIFRFVHTVKGSCGFLDLPRIGALAHAAEDALDAVRQSRRVAGPALVSAVLAIIDRIIELTGSIAISGHEPEGSDAALIAGIAAANDEVAVPVSEVAAAHGPRESWRTVRVPLHLLDTMMSGVSDMVLARNEVARLIRQGASGAVVTSAFDRLSGSIADMRQSVGQMRMQRIEKLLATLPRLVRDLARDLGKRVDVTLEGSEVEIDREMIEMIRDPLTHIIRNAVDHGLEAPDVRRAAGKPETGRLCVGVRQSGNQIMIRVADDGAGIAVDRLVEKAIAAKVISAEEARTLTPRERLNLVFAPGLSTARAITAISGRGVGMDVVRSNVERIGGVVELDNAEGEGLAITLRVPLTLTIMSGLTVSAADQLFAIPRTSVSEIILQASDAIRIDRAGGADIAIVRGERLPLVHLETALGAARPSGDGNDRSIVITRGAGGQRYALSVADVFDHEELVIKPAAPAIMASGLYAGTTLPDNGRPMLLLDSAGLAARADIGAAQQAMQAALASTAAAPVQEAVPCEPILLFLDYDGVRRGIRLAAVDRVEDVPANAIARTGGVLRAAIGDRLVALFDAPVPPDVQRVKLLRLNDGAADIGYGVRDVLDIVQLPVRRDPAPGAGPVESVTLVDGEPMEIVDPLWLFASLEPPSGACLPICRLVDDEDGWTRRFLAPLIGGAGYRVVFGDAPIDEGSPEIRLITAPSLVSISAGDGCDDERTVRLRPTRAPRDPDDRSIYRYDRAAILSELARRAGER